MTSSFDLCFVADATGSMDLFLQGIKDALPEILQLVRLTTMIDNIGIMAFKDYSDKQVLSWSGWSQDFTKLENFRGTLRAEGGADRPEAVKTALAQLTKEVVKPTIAIIMTDAPPHHRFSGSHIINWGKENKALGEFFDWIALANAIRDKQIHCLTMLSCEDAITTSFYALLGNLTQGVTVSLKSTRADAITRHTIGMILSLEGESYDFGKDVVRTTLSQFDAVKVNTQTEETSDCLPDRYGRVQTTVTEMTSGEVPSLKKDVSKLLNLLDTDDAYRNKVYDVLDSIISPEYILSLTYNSIFAKYWRYICRRRDDSRREALVGKMGGVISKLNPSVREKLQTFIEDSYDQTEALMESFRKVPIYPAFILETKATIDRKQLLEICRSCNPRVLKNVGNLMTGIISVQNGAVPDTYVPGSLEPKQLFQTLPHLLCPGTLFSIRAAAILACIAVTTESCLTFQAESFLESVKGRWIDFNQPENCAYDFIKFILRLPQVLTEQEMTTLTTLRDLGSLASNSLAQIEVELPITVIKACRPDNKMACSGCHKERSFTLMTDTNVCGLCIEGTPEVVERERNKSYFCECGSCLVHYAVVRPHQLNVRPKCHFCRAQEGKPTSERNQPPSIICGECQNRYLWQLSGTPPDFICPPCQAGAPKSETCSLTVKELIQENGLATAGFKVKSDPSHSCCQVKKDNNSLVLSVFKESSVFKLKEHFVRTDITSDSDGKVAQLLYHRKPVLNESEVRQSLKKLITGGSIELSTCDLCFEEFLPKHLRTVCGRKGCGSRACDECLSAWYAAPAPGKVCLVPNLLCPFCKKTPAPKIISKYNKQLSLIRDFDRSTLDSTWYYGWCEGCYAITPAVEKICSEDVPVLAKFKCETCIAEKDNVVTKDCPECGVTTLRTSGCAHLTCPNCNTHWCWICGERSTYNDIYRHIATKHGGYGFDDNEQEDPYYSDGYYSDDY